jgi:hypothetical protein
MTAQLWDIPMTSEEFEQIEPIRRVVPPRRRRTGPPRAAVAAAFIGALLAAVGAVAARAPLDTTWSVATGSVRTAEGELAAGDDIPFEVAVTVGAEETMLESGIGRLSLTPGTVATLGSPAAGSVGNLKLASGEVLVDTDIGRYTVNATIAVLVGDGVFRVARDEAPRLAVYRGNAAATSGLFGSLGPFTQLSLDGGSGDVRPIALDSRDAWDALHAAVPLDTDRQIQQLRVGLEATYGTSPQRPAFYADFVGVTPGLEVALAELAPTVRGALFGPPADTLIAAAVLETLRLGQGLPQAQIIGQILPDRAAGGSWGVLMAQRDLDGSDLRVVADDALRRRANLGGEAVSVIDGPVSQTPQRRPQPQPTISTRTPDEPSTPTTTPSDPPTDDPTEDPTQDPTEDPSPFAPPTDAPTGDPAGTIGDLLDPEAPNDPIEQGEQGDPIDPDDPDDPDATVPVLEVTMSQSVGVVGPSRLIERLLGVMSYQWRRAA